MLTPTLESDLVAELLRPPSRKSVVLTQGTVIMHTRAGIEQLKIRIPKKLARELETLAKIEQVAKVDLALQLPWEGGARRSTSGVFSSNRCNVNLSHFVALGFSACGLYIL
jgi:hypothetical protein